jgi:GalNAc5-diNAcBac-PP-undecaprenol beta-1,3-glucosyltransferase
MTEATVLVPTYDHGEILLCSVRSALAQTVRDIEVLIVGDGINPEGREAAHILQREDPRVRFFDNPKQERHGEFHRHEALKGATGRIVCYLSDDDLWTPDHVEGMAEALRDHDFAHALPLEIHADGGIKLWRCDLSLDYFRAFILEKDNRIPLSCGAHTLKLYRNLRVGWSPPPPSERHSDLFMWRKLLSHPGVRLKSTMRPTVLHFPDPLRREMPHGERIAELREWEGKLRADRGAFLYGVIAALSDQWARGFP